MKHIQPGSIPPGRQGWFYAFTSLVSRLIRTFSVFLLVLWSGFAATAVAVDTAQYYWHNSGVRSFLSALEEDLADQVGSTAGLNAQPPLHFKDPLKVQKDETRNRRKLAAELKQRKSPDYGAKSVLKNDRKI